MDILNTIANESVKFCKEHLLKEPTRVSYPGGISKRTLRMFFDDESIILTNRESAKHREIENNVLNIMNEHGAAVPKILFEQDGWLVQEDIGNQTLVEVVNKLDSPFEKSLCLKSALNNLLNIHDIASKTQLKESCNQIGVQPDWLKKFIMTPTQIGNHINFPSPELPADELLNKLKVRQPSFIKWDCRLKNAGVDMKKHDIVWLDWHHAGVRNKLDDFVWFVGDDHFPVECEDEIVKNYLQKFALGFDSIEEAFDYFAHFITIYTSIRLFNLILIRSKVGSWEKAHEVSKLHRNNVNIEMAKNLCLKGKRWSERADMLNPLSEWFDGIYMQLNDKGDFDSKVCDISDRI